MKENSSFSFVVPLKTVGLTNFMLDNNNAYPYLRCSMYFIVLYHKRVLVSFQGVFLDNAYPYLRCPMFLDK